MTRKGGDIPDCSSICILPSSSTTVPSPFKISPNAPAPAPAPFPSPAPASSWLFGIVAAAGLAAHFVKDEDANVLVLVPVDVSPVPLALPAPAPALAPEPDPHPPDADPAPDPAKGEIDAKLPNPDDCVVLGLAMVDATPNVAFGFSAFSTCSDGASCLFPMSTADAFSEALAADGGADGSGARNSDMGFAGGAATEAAGAGVEEPNAEEVGEARAKGEAADEKEANVVWVFLGFAGVGAEAGTVTGSVGCSLAFVYSAVACVGLVVKRR